MIGFQLMTLNFKTKLLYKSLLYFSFQAAESQKASSDVDRGTINAFDSQSPAFVAVVVALSFFLFIVLIGGKLCYFITRQLNRRRNARLMAACSEDLAPQGNLKSCF